MLETYSCKVQKLVVGFSIQSVYSRYTVHLYDKKIYLKKK